MTTKSENCPSKEVLTDFELGKLDASRAETVGAHVATCVDCRHMLDQVKTDRVATSPHIPAELADHPDYEIVRELGQGGMGVVYLARNRMMDRLEVLKVVSRSLLDRPGAMERFQQEIRSAAKLSHPNIVAAYSVIRPGNLLVLCMEFVDGQDLGETVKQRGPLPVVNAAFYIHQVALGLQHAHDKGMVHRDIKPGNLMLAVVNKKHVVKILDFGLAKATSEKMQDGGLTKSGQMLGTPDYIAPEQTLDAQKADIRADIYSLGCTLYYLLSGRPPFDGASLYEILHAHHSVEAKPLNLVRPEVPAELAAVVAKMMAKDPANRYQTPTEVAQALKPFFQGGSQATKADHSLPPQAAPPIPPQPPLPLPGQSGSIPLPMARAVPLAAPQYQFVAATAPGLADLETMTSAGGSKSAVRLKARGNSGRWKTPVILVAVGLAGFLLLAAVMFKVRTRDGILAITVNEPGPEVAIDGEQVRVSWADGGKQAEISVPAGSHKIELKKDGYKAIGERVEIERAGRLFLSAKLEPLPKPEQESAAVAPSEPASALASGKREPAGDSAPSSAKLSASGQQIGTPPPAIAPFDAAQARAHQEAWATHLGVPVEQTNSIGMKLVLIPPGEFMMGSPDAEQGRHANEGPQHRVAITHPFAIGATEVTVDNFRRFVEATGYRTEIEQDGKGWYETFASASARARHSEIVWSNPGVQQTGRHPVVLASWNDAVAFCNWLSTDEGFNSCYRQDDIGWTPLYGANGYRLPTEAEWEYACRAGTASTYNFGDKFEECANYIWWGRGTGAVATKAPNGFGLFDTHGNVAERCQDWYDERYYETRTSIDPLGPEHGVGRVLRGGDWNHVVNCYRAAYRGGSPVGWFVGTHIGFRVVRGPAPMSPRRESSAQESIVMPRTRVPSSTAESTQEHRNDTRKQSANNSAPRARTTVVAGSDDSRTCWVNDNAERQFIKQGQTWIEREIATGKNIKTFYEVNRNVQFVEIHTTVGELAVRLYEDHAEGKWPGVEWTRLSTSRNLSDPPRTGRWRQTK